MSFWSKISTVIRDLDVFKAVCEKNNVQYEDVTGTGMSQQGYPVKARITDMQEGGPAYQRQAYLVEADGAYRLIIDNDAGYSSLTARLGKNGGVMMRDYTQQTVEKSIRAQGGMIQSRVAQPDGSLIIQTSFAA